MQMISTRSTTCMTKLQYAHNLSSSFERNSRALNKRTSTKQSYNPMSKIAIAESPTNIVLSDYYKVLANFQNASILPGTRST